MHSLTDYEANIPAFLAKLWNMVEDPSSDELIAWGTNGLSFVIKDQSKFAKELLPMYYKHNNMASFIRQLNMYGFHKNLSLESGCAKMEEVIIEFYHPCFQKDQPSLLPNIKRKINSARSSAGASNTATVASQTDVVNQVLHDVRKMKSRQDSVDSRLTQMKIENEALWREVAILRQKHMKQQQIVNKLIQFLVSIVQHPHGLSVKRRNLPLMLQDRSATSKQLQQNTNNQSLSGISEITRSPSGPVIHEIDPSDYAASLLLNEVRVDDGITSPQDATILMDNPASQESVADNDETLATADVVAVDAGDGDLEGSELLDLPNQLLLADADAVASDEIADETRSEAANSSDGQNESVFTRPNQIRASKRRPRKPAATKKLSYQVQVADNPQQPDITGLVLDDFPLIIPGSQALQELTSAAESTADDVTTQSPVYIETLTSPPNVNLTADPLVESPASLYGDGSDLGEFVDPNQVIINAPTIVNCPMPIVTPEKTAKFKKIVPKPDQSQPRVKTIRPLQSKRKMPPPLKTTAAGKKSKQMTGDKSTTPIALLAATTNLPTSVGKTRTPIGSPCNVANLPAAPSATVSKQMAEQSSENSDRTVACMSPSNSQQSLKQEIDSHVDSMQSDLETLKELLKGESISLDANTLLGKLSSSTLSHYLTFNNNEGFDFDNTTDLLFNSEDPFSLTMDLPSQTQSQEDKLKEPDNKIVSYSTANNQELNDIFGDYNDWILSSPGNEALNEDDDVYNIPELNTPDILLTPDPMLPPASKKKKK